MSDQEKDRLGDKLHDVEAAREDQWAHQRDQELLEKMRKKLGPGAALQCPRCKRPLEARVLASTHVDLERRIGRGEAARVEGGVDGAGGPQGQLAIGLGVDHAAGPSPAGGM